MRGRRAPRAAVLLAPALACLLQACALFKDRAASDDDLAEAEAEPGQGLPVRYDVAFEGADVDPELRAALEAASASRRDAARPPASRFLLERRAEADLENLRRALASLGYYDGNVAYAIRDLRPEGSRGPDWLRGAPIRLAFEVTPGPRYRFENLRVEVAGPGGLATPTPEELGLRRGEPARAQSVLDARDALLGRAGSSGHPLAKADEPDAVIDKDRKTMDVALRLEPGPRADFAKPTFSGGENVDRTYLRRRVGFGAGEAFDPAKVAEARRALVETALFSTVVVRQGEALDETGRLPVRFELAERKPRSIGGGVGFRTEEGPNASVFWEHRNLDGAGERLRLELYGSPVRQEATAGLRKPDVGRRDQNFLVDGSLRAEDTDAYSGRSAGAGVAVERALTRKLKVSLGVAYRFVNAAVKDEPKQNYGLFSLPASLAWDGSNDLLDPTRGGRITLLAAPTVDTLGQQARYLRTLATATRYVPLSGDPRVVLAFRTGVGSILGASRDAIAADERFYAGGGGSVRGFAYQLAGPLDDDDDPVGGRSLLELGSEVRWRVTESVGVVPFLDAGTAFDAPLPDFSESLRFGAGLGLRYITPIGPVRFDVGVPLNPREGVDDPYQIYISLGQAF